MSSFTLRRYGCRLSQKCITGNLSIVLILFVASWCVLVLSLWNEDAGKTDLFVSLHLMRYQWYPPPGIPGADVGERRGIYLLLESSPRGGYLVGIHLYSISLCLSVFGKFLVNFTDTHISLSHTVHNNMGYLCRGGWYAGLCPRYGAWSIRTHQFPSYLPSSPRYVEVGGIPLIGALEALFPSALQRFHCGTKLSCMAVSYF